MLTAHADKVLSWPARPLALGALPALSLPVNHIFTFALHPLLHPTSSSAGRTLPTPQAWDGEPAVRLPGANTDPLPTGHLGWGCWC